jgi:uncharacterized membrane protein
MLALSKRFLPALRKLRLTDWVAFVLLAVYVATFSWMAIRQHAGFRTQALDLAKFDQAIWNTARGHPFRITLIQSSVIQSHFSPSLALYAPLYWLWDDVRLLFVAQSICLGGAGFLVYWFFRRDAPWLGLVVYAAYLMHPSLHHVNLIEFRRVTIAVLASSFALYHMLRRSYVWMLVGLSIALLSKEDLAFLVIGVGLYVVLAHRSFKVGIPLLIVGLAWLVLVPFVILPDLSVSHSDLSSETYVHSRKNFSYLGESPVEMLQTLWRNPTAPLRYVLRPERMTAVFHLCWPTAFLFLLAPEITAFTLPFLGYLLASKYNVMGTLGAWYPSVLLPILYWAVAVGISRVRGRWRMVMLAALLACGFGGWFLNDLPPVVLRSLPTIARSRPSCGGFPQTLSWRRRTPWCRIFRTASRSICFRGCLRTCSRITWCWTGRWESIRWRSTRTARFSTICWPARSTKLTIKWIAFTSFATWAMYRLLWRVRINGMVH